jgi:hypothetical protein
MRAFIQATGPSESLGAETETIATLFNEIDSLQLTSTRSNIKLMQSADRTSDEPRFTPSPASVSVVPANGRADFTASSFDFTKLRVATDNLFGLGERPSVTVTFPESGRAPCAVALAPFPP